MQAAPGLEMSIPLDYDQERAGQLGTLLYKNVTEAELHAPRDTIAAKEKGKIYYLQVKFSTVEFGTFNSSPACLSTFRFDFQQLSTSRFKKAIIEIRFEDETNLSLDPHGDDEIDLTHQPRIVAFSPHEYQGPVDSRDGQSQASLSVSASAPGGFVAVVPGYSKTTPSISRGAFKMHGTVRDKPPSRLVWTVRENELSREGIRSNFSVAVITSYTPHRRFSARIRVEADVWLSLFVRPVCGVKDDPICFDPDWIVANIPAASPKAADSHLEKRDLNALTRLEVDGGKFL